MFAGRYLWWNMFAVMAYVFFAIYFFYVSWLAIRVSGCAALSDGCGGLEVQLNAVVRADLSGQGELDLAGQLGVLALLAPPPHSIAPVGPAIGRGRAPAP